jgi:hypothetical protein
MLQFVETPAGARKLYFCNMASLKTVKKWEQDLSCDLEKEINGGKVRKLKCKVCCKYEYRITSIKGFS